MLLFSTAKPTQGDLVPDLSQGFLSSAPVAQIWNRPRSHMSLVKYHLFSMSFGGFILIFLYFLPLGLVLKLGTTMWCLDSSMSSG